mgnify:CR=1 FL=1
MRILIKKGPGPFRVPPKTQIDLIRNGSREMFLEVPWADTAFASTVIRDSIQNPKKEFAGIIEEPWAWFNSFGVNMEREVVYQEHPDLTVGKRWRENELLVRKLKDECGFEAVEIDSDSYYISKDGRGERAKSLHES